MIGSRLRPVAIGIHVSVRGSNLSARKMARADPGTATSSLLALENTITSPFGRRTPVPYQRGSLSFPVKRDSYGIAPSAPTRTISMRESAVGR
jgi:hypothetical protein